MKAEDTKFLPLARAERLVVEELPDEMLVYDLERDRAHCLNRAAALVWKRCDGRTTAKEIAELLGKELETSVEEEFVWLALRELDEFHLLQDKIKVPAAMAGMTRRQMTVSLGVAAVLAIPVILSISAPTAAQAGSGATGATGVTGVTGPQG